MDLTHVPAAPTLNPAVARLGRTSWHDACPPPAAAPAIAPSEQAHAALAAAFRATGGLARADDLARLLEYLDHGDFISLARHIAARTVFGFHWRESLWIPMFQFNLRDLSLRDTAQAVRAELDHQAFDGWALACWFADANPWLGGQRPVDLLDRDGGAVRAAARADRFALHG